MIQDGPLSYRLEDPQVGIIKQKLITLFVRDGMLVEETIERDYADDGDYTDSVTTVPLVAVKEIV
jgi:hypothetical protein